MTVRLTAGMYGVDPAPSWVLPLKETERAGARVREVTAQLAAVAMGLGCRAAVRIAVRTAVRRAVRTQ